MNVELIPVVISVLGTPSTKLQKQLGKIRTETNIVDLKPAIIYSARILQKVLEL